MHLPSLRIAAVATLALAVIPLAHCSNDSLQTAPSTGTIGPSGGSLASSDYAFEILVPAGALSTDVTFTITPLAAPPTSSSPTGANVYAPAYTISTSSTTPVSFAIPAVFSFSEEALTVNDFNDPTDYRVATFGSSDWVPLANPSVDLLAYTLEATSTVLSPNAYSVIVPVGGSCVSVTESCAGDDAGCSPTCAPVIPAKCAAYAGSYASTCEVDDASTGIAVSCCYPTGQPLCFTQSEPNGCESPCSQLPGSTAQSCVQDVGPPLQTAPDGYAQSTCCFPSGAPVCMLAHGAGTTCQSASLCAAFPGSTLSSCTSVSGGTEATCCMDAADGGIPTVLPTGLEEGDAGPVVQSPDAGADATAPTGTDSGAGTDASGGTDANGGTDASEPDAGSDAGLDGGDDAGG